MLTGVLALAVVFGFPGLPWQVVVTWSERCTAHEAQTMSLVGNMLVRLHLAQGEQRMVAESSAGLGIFFFLSGGLLFLWQKKSVFDRTNQFGVEQFSSFWGKLVAKAKDKLISGVAITLLFGGLLILATAYESTWGGIVLLPFYLFVLFMVIGA